MLLIATDFSDILLRRTQSKPARCARKLQARQRIQNQFAASIRGFVLLLQSQKGHWYMVGFAIAPMDAVATWQRFSGTKY